MPHLGRLGAHRFAHPVTANERPKVARRRGWIGFGLKGRQLRASLKAAVIAACVSLPIPVVQTESAAALKAEFLLKFAKFTDWPSSALSRTTPLSICVAGAPEVAEALAVRVGEKVRGRPLSVREVISGASMPPCHMLYVAADHHVEDGALRAVFAQPAVLSISDVRHFAHSGGIVELSVENDRMQFAVNVDAARRAGLQVSSRLLNLATIVRDARW
jgi:YfiR/HmsC-like